MTETEYNTKLKVLILSCTEPFERYMKLDAKKCLYEYEGYVDFNWSVVWEHARKDIPEEKRGDFGRVSDMLVYLYGPVAGILLLGFEETMRDLAKEYRENYEFEK